MKFRNEVYWILHFISVISCVLFVGIGTDYVKVGDYREWMFVVGCVSLALPFLYAFTCFWWYCLKTTHKKPKKEEMPKQENDMARRIFEEKLIPSHCLEQYEKFVVEIDRLKETNKKLRKQIKTLKENSKCQK